MKNANVIIKIKKKIRYIFDYFIANTIFRKKIARENNHFNIMSDRELVDEIVINKKSFARFGDGELSIITDSDFEISFQRNSSALSKHLKEVLNSNLDDLIIGINVGLNNPYEYNKKAQRYFRVFNYKKRKQFARILPVEKKYGNSSITRFYIDYDHKDLKNAQKRLDNLKRIWTNRNLLIVEGRYTKLGVGNELLKGAKSIRRIIVPEINAFSRIDDIEKSIIENRKSNELILLAVGPTATVLAYRLAHRRLQAVDVGHVDIEYEWMKMGARKRVRIPGKYTNEIKGKKIIENDEDGDNYTGSIIARIE